SKREMLEKIARYLEEELATDVAVFHEGLDNTLRPDGEPPPRLQQLLDFRGKPSTAILVCEDLAAEGHNLHSTCHTVVLFDLPVNPNTTEQRIGRIDRLGQSKDVIVHALVIEGTEEAARLERQAALGVFEHSIGALTPSEEEALARGEKLGARRDLTSPLRAFRNRPSDELEARIRATLEAPEGWVFRASARFQDWFGEGVLAQQCLGATLTRAVLRAFDLKAEKNEDPPPRVRESLRFRLARGDQPIPGYRDIWGTLDRDEALEQDHLQFFASGHPFVEDVIARAFAGGQRQALRFRLPGRGPLQGVLAHFVWDPASAVEGSFAKRLARVALPVLSVPVVVGRPAVGLVTEAGPPSRENPSLLRSLLEALTELDPTHCESLLADPYPEEQATVLAEAARAAALENVRARLGRFPDTIGRRALARSRSEVERDGSLDDRDELLAAIAKISTLATAGFEEALVLDAAATFEIR
ncbi:MAG TPA: C-terminal helicase domain-containing protein, partial [Planctomycetota bacterium]|nr:C-terminal helicase domain-containing protein [Planctomycetota bacterium]